MRGISNIFIFIAFWFFFLTTSTGFGFILIPIYYYLVFHNAASRENKAREKLKNTLMKNESVVDYGIQNRIYALFTRRKLIAITNSRLILISRSIFGGFSMKDYQWKDLLNANISENILPNICGSKISFTVSNSHSTMTIDGLQNHIASSIYSHAQAQEQEWEEKNRIRSLEEIRAMSGASVVNVGEQVQTEPKENNIFSSLEKAKQLFDSAAISDSEYQELKSKILSGSKF